MTAAGRWPALAIGAATAAEVVGAAGVIVGSFLGWEWRAGLWSRDDILSRVVQVGVIGLAVALVAGWWLRDDDRQAAARAGVRLAAAVVAFAATAVLLTQVGANVGAGGVVTAVAAVVVFTGAWAWTAAVNRHYGTSGAVQQPRMVGGGRVRLAGAGAGTVAAGVLLTTALVAAQHLVGSEDAGTTERQVFAGEVPGLQQQPAWQVSMSQGQHPAARPFAQVTTGGLLLPEAAGVRLLDPGTGEVRWHWRDETYRLLNVVVTGTGRTVVLALTVAGAVDAPDDGRDHDQVVALDAATGDVRWRRYDDTMVSRLRRTVAPSEGDWFAVVGDEAARKEAGSRMLAGTVGDPVGATVFGVDDGAIRWVVDEDRGCSFDGFAAVDSTTLVLLEHCPVGRATECRVSGLGTVAGEVRWSWRPPAEPTDDHLTGCRLRLAGGLAIVAASFEERGSATRRMITALDAGAGGERWTLPGDLSTVDLDTVVAAGDLLVGIATVDERDGLRVRRAEDGTVLRELELPLPVRSLVSAGAERVLVNTYADSAGVNVFAEVDVARGEVTASAPLPERDAGMRVSSMRFAVGPQTLALVVVQEPRDLDRVEVMPSDRVTTVYGFG